MSTDVERTLLQYRLIEKLGEGGMGIVYRAEDTRLHRPVALKFLTDQAYSRRGLARFLREARLAAALNHPTICTIYEVAESPVTEWTLPSGETLQPGTPFIAMELIEGRTLKDSLDRSRDRSLDALLRVAAQIAEGLAVAHAKGIMHRDLKPGNVMLTEDGRAKILDFGLARSTETGDATVTVETKDTTAADPTLEGMVVGTTPYMSPEQARGERLDCRSDVFSFGILLYEMVYGVRPFRGETSAATLLKIMEAEPELSSESRAAVPPELARILRRCLKKRPEERYNDTRDLVASIKDLIEETTSGRRSAPPTDGAAAAALWSAEAATIPVPAARRPRARRWIVALAAIVMAGMLGVAYFTLFREEPGPAPLPYHRRLTFTGTVHVAHLSPDGQYLAYVDRATSETEKLEILDLSSPDAHPLEVFEAIRFGDVRWSPDGTELLVSAATDPHDSFWWAHLVPRFGGSARRLPGKFNIFAWSPDGTRIARVYQPGKEMWITDKFTGESQSLPLNGSFRFILELDWSSTANHLLMLTNDVVSKQIWSVAPQDGSLNLLVDSAWAYSPRWSPCEDALYFLTGRGAARDLRKLRVDADTGLARGDPVTVLTGLSGANQLSLSRDGRAMAYVKLTAVANIWLLTIRQDEAGADVATRQLTSGALFNQRPDVSPDGRMLVYSRRGDIYTMSVEGGEEQQLTFLDTPCIRPVWSPDGSEVAFVAGHGEASRIWKVSATGGAAREFEGTSPPSGHLAWAPGERILYQLPGNQNFHLLDPETGEETPLLADDSLGWVFNAQYSRDGTRVALWWNRRNNEEDGPWVIPLDGSEMFQVGQHDARPIAWSADGEWIYAIRLTPRPQAIVKLEVRGGREDVVAESPFHGRFRGCRMTIEGSQFVCLVDESTSDVWLVENFDPDVR